ncbi:MAG: LacI family DNA-binding transcriptional regulator, partial [Dehalococcoidia bacterium]
MPHTTIRDVAARAGVSKSLVSLVLRGQNNVSPARRAAVLRTVAELGYRPNAAARSLVQQRTHMVGVLLSDLHNPFFAEITDGIQYQAQECGYRMLITTGERTRQSEAEAL